MHVWVRCPRAAVYRGVGGLFRFGIKEHDQQIQGRPRREDRKKEEETRESLQQAYAKHAAERDLLSLRDLEGPHDHDGEATCEEVLHHADDACGHVVGAFVHAVHLALVCQVPVEVDLHPVGLDWRAAEEKSDVEGDHIGDDEGDAGLDGSEIPLREEQMQAESASGKKKYSTWDKK